VSESQSDDIAVPIREISRVTGVNSVTLRAWERRYGLLTPTRTAKGHRLYSLADIQRVKDIQCWLARGLAIGKVKTLLADDKINNSINVVHGDVWDENFQKLTTILHQLNRRKIELFLNELFVEYPLDLIADQLLAPFINKLQQPGYANITRLSFLNAVLGEHIASHQSHQRQNARGESVLVMKLNPDECDILPRILNYAFLINGYRAEYCGALPANEWVYAVEQLRPKVLVIYSDSVNRIVEVKNQLESAYIRFNIPLLVGGKITDLFASTAGDSAIISVGNNFQQILAGFSTYFPARSVIGVKEFVKNRVV
jgi:DNA-binding transcriptional MerR regulator